MATATPTAIAEEVSRVEAQRLREDDLRQQRDKVADDIVVQMQKVRVDLEASVTQLHQLAMDLRAKARRTLDSSSSGYILYANAHLRVAGALNQGLKRTGSMDRVLVVSKQEEEDERRREEEDRQDKEVREHDRLVENLSLPSDDDFEELYGEVVSNG